MALRAVTEHPKFARLSRLLSLPKYATLGLLEASWHFTGKFAPHGNIGKFPDKDIESWIGWDGAPGAYIEAAVKSGWFDDSPLHRLLIHDWARHCDDATKLAVKRSKKPFCSDNVTRVSPQRSDTILQSETSSRLPEPEPVPEPAKEPLPAKPEVDPRHRPCRVHLEIYWRSKHPDGPACPWDASEAKQLKLFLDANPGESSDSFARLLTHRADSELNHSARPRTWIATLTDFARGPLDRYSKPKGSYGTHSSGPRGAAIGRVQRTRDAFRKAGLASAAAAGGFASGADWSGIPEPGVRGGYGDDVAARDGDAGGGVQPAASAEGSRIVPDAPEILPPPKPNTGGFGIHDGQRAQR
jgi:hypothetical protein